jgi:hypothetical protein
MVKDAIDLINRKNAEIEKLQAVIEAIDNDINPLPFETDFDKAIKTARAEAIKEFAERVKAELGDDYGWLDCSSDHFYQIAKEMGVEL